jgi:hypothetical protein
MFIVYCPVPPTVIELTLYEALTAPLPPLKLTHAFAEPRIGLVAEVLFVPSEIVVHVIVPQVIVPDMIYPYELKKAI